MNVTMNVGKVGTMTGDFRIVERLAPEITATKAAMKSADEGEQSFLLGKLTALLIVRDGLDDVVAYKKALAIWENARRGQS